MQCARHATGSPPRHPLMRVPRGYAARRHAFMVHLVKVLFELAVSQDPPLLSVPPLTRPAPPRCTALTRRGIDSPRPLRREGTPRGMPEGRRRTARVQPVPVMLARCSRRSRATRDGILISYIPAGRLGGEGTGARSQVIPLLLSQAKS